MGREQRMYNVGCLVWKLSQKTPRFTYLDSTIGRPVIILRKTNVLTDHNVPMEITFDYDETMMYHEPALLVGFYFTMFFLYMFFSRLNLNISKAPKKKTA